ncbi:MAG: glycerol-3-phosphate acyltransferase [Sediminispirochaetaceae bacterium]
MTITTSFILISIAAVLAGYLSGSVNYAVYVTRAVIGKDIRTIGNRNPGTSNVTRSVGKKWGFLVGFLDAFKIFGPLVLARILLFPDYSDLHFSVLYLMGIAGVVGHCLPVFYRFKGGGGIGTMQGVSLFFIPVEYLVSMLIGGTIVLLFFKKVQYKYGQWTPIMFVTLTPFMTLLTTMTLDIPLFAHISIGGHPWSIVAGAFVLSFTILALNINFMRSRADELKSIEGEEQED